jgi:hypothetical protein
MKHTSRNIFLTLLLILSIALTACGASATPTTAPVAEAPVATEAPATEAPTEAPAAPPTQFNSQQQHPHKIRLFDTRPHVRRAVRLHRADHCSGYR